MSDRTPWWYSGDEPDEANERLESGPGEPGPSEPGAGTGAPVDWMGLLAGAARMVDWATSAVLTPHAEHSDPAEHPQCVVCRAMLLVGDRSAAASDEAGEAAAAPSIRWIPVVDEPDA